MKPQAIAPAGVAEQQQPSPERAEAEGLQARLDALFAGAAQREATFQQKALEGPDDSVEGAQQAVAPGTRQAKLEQAARYGKDSRHFQKPAREARKAAAAEEEDAVEPRAVAVVAVADAKTKDEAALQAQLDALPPASPPSMAEMHALLQAQLISSQEFRSMAALTAAHRARGTAGGGAAVLTSSAAGWDRPLD